MLSNISTIFVIIILILLLIYRKRFNLKDVPISKKGKSFLLISIIVLIFINMLFFGRAYYIAYNPNYQIEETENLVGHHIYQPNYLPRGMYQDTVFHIRDMKRVNKKNSVRAAYVTSSNADQESRGLEVVVINQVKIDPEFKLLDYINILEKEDKKTDLIVQPLNIDQLSDQPGYTIKHPIYSEVAVFTTDNILISVVSPTLPLSDLVLMAASLQ